MRGSGVILMAIFLAFGGLLVAGLLSVQQADLTAMERLCGQQGGCARVLSSRFAKIGPVPLSVVGTAFYLTMLGGLLLCLGLPAGRPRRGMLRGLLLLGGAGATASAGLMVVQFLVIRAFCPLCTLSALFMMLIAALLWRAWREQSWESELRLALMLPGIFIPTAGLVTAALVQGMAQRPAGDQALARVNGRPILASQMEEEVRSQVLALESRLYDVRQEWVLRKIDEALIEQEAGRRGVPVEELVRQEVDEQIRPAAEALERWIAERRARDTAFEWYNAQLKGMDELLRNRRMEWLESLRAGRDIQVMLSPPAGMPLKIDPALVHRLGPEGAAVRLMLFSDFECPYCAELAGVIQEVMQTFPMEMSLESIHLPLKSHSQAFDAAVASECAARQGKFWLYHDELMKQRGQLDGKWEQAAQTVGLDLERFRTCMISPESRQHVERARQAGQNLGLNAVPVLYVNGRQVGGLLTVEELTQLVRLERARSERR